MLGDNENALEQHTRPASHGARHGQVASEAHREGTRAAPRKGKASRTSIEPSAAMKPTIKFAALGRAEIAAEKYVARRRQQGREVSDEDRATYVATFLEAEPIGG